MPTTITSAIAETYAGFKTEDVQDIARKAGQFLTRKFKSADKAGREAGATLQLVRDSGLAMVATVEDADERENTPDGRSTAVSNYMRVYAPTVDPKRYHEWLQLADSLTVLDKAGVPSADLSPSVHRKMTKTVTAAAWAKAVKAASDKAAKAAKAAGDKAVKPPTAAAVAAELGGKSRNGKSKTTTPASVVLTAGNALLVAVTADDFVPTKAEATLLANIVAAIG